MLASEKIAPYTMTETTESVMEPFFYGGHWGQCLDLISHLCQYSDNLILVIGREGLGKTTLKEALLIRCADKFVFHVCQEAVKLDPRDLIEQIDASLNTSGQDLVLVVDDVQNLPVDMIPVLLKLKQDIKFPWRLHIVLFAEPEFERLIQKAAVKERCADQLRVIELETLTLSDVEAFLLHNWQLAGNHSELPLDKIACKKIFSLSAGNPREVQKLAKSMLEGGDINKLKIVRGALSPFIVGLVVAFGILFCILAFLWPTKDDITTIESQPLTVQNELALPETDAALEEPVNNEDKQTIVKLEEKLLSLEQQLLDEQEARRNVELKLQTALQKPRIEPVKVQKQKNKMSTTGQEKNILNIPATNYTVQLLGAANEAKIKEFIKTNNLTDKARYFKTSYKDKPWYILIYGNYSTKAAANEALNALPPNLKKLQPWPREYKTIHSIIKKN